MTEARLLRERAAAARAAADKEPLANIRAVHLRSAEKLDQMADRADRMEAVRR